MKQNKKLHIYNKNNLSITNCDNYFVRCPIHGEINFYSNELWLYKLINTPHFQRLSKIKQLNFCNDHFPGATHTRLIHSLGVYEIARIFIEELIKQKYLILNPQTQIIIDITLATALLHDIGHGPHSHGIETYFAYNHEEIAVKIINEPQNKIHQILVEKSLTAGCNKYYYIQKIADLITNKNKDLAFAWAQDLISSSLDVDRLDFLNRDASISGAFYFSIKPSFFSKWCLILSEVHFKNNSAAEKEKYLNKLAFLPKTQNSIYFLFFVRNLMYKEIYHNKYSLFREELTKLMIQHWYAILPDHQVLSVKYKNLYSFLLPYLKEMTFYDAKLFIDFTDEKLNSIIETFSEFNDQLLQSYYFLFTHYEDSSSHQCYEFNHLEYQDFIKKFPNLSIKDCSWITKTNIKFYNETNPILIYYPKLEKVFPYHCTFKEELAYPENKLAIIAKKILFDWKKQIK